MHKRSTAPLVVLVAALALALGSFGTATAAGLTKGSVKKIAAKVVQKAAPKLSVASAVNAGNATNLGGRPASAYLSQATVYTSTTSTPSTVHSIPLPLAPGSYTIGYSVVMGGATGYSFCQVKQVRGASTTYAADDTSQTVSLPASVSGYGLVQVQSGDVITLRCSSATAWTIAADEPAQVVVTPVDLVTTPAPLAATASRGTRAAAR